MKPCLQFSQDGGDPNKPVFGLLDGACGYGEFSKTEWPNWQVAAISQSNPIAQRGQPQKRGCGACIEVACNSTVRASLFLSLSKPFPGHDPSGYQHGWYLDKGMSKTCGSP